MFLKIKKIPKTKWSSTKPSNLKPKFNTFIFLCTGLVLFGLGEGLLIVSYAGSSPWSVLAQGIALHTNFTVGVVTRSAPQLNLFSFGFPITLLVVFLGLYASATPLGYAMEELVEFSLSFVDQFFESIYNGQ